MVKRSLYCGGGFLDSQLLWIIPILDGYCESNNIDTIIFEKKLSNKLIKNNYISSVINKYKISYLKSDIFFLQILNIIIFFLKNLYKIIYYPLIINRKILLNKEISWKKIQIYHSIWDTSFFYLKDGDLSPNFFHKLKATLKVFLNIYFAYSLKKRNISAAFMGHSVYTARAMIAVFRKFKIRIIIEAMHSLYILPSLFDNSWSILNKRILFKLHNSKIINQSLTYWKARLKGNANYEDARVAFNKKIYKKKKYNFNNVILLHIFRDSPFNIIDRERIFSDYIDWIDNTLRIIRNSNEEWIVKPHPNFKRWGENSHKTYQEILNKIINKHEIKNIKYFDGKISNIELLKNAKRIVTFSGTAHLEAACLGLKPIVISNCTLASFPDEKFVFKPKSLYQYKKLLLTDSKSSIFKLSNKKKKYAKFILFIRENVINLRKNLGSNSIYRNDGSKIRDYEFNNISKKLDKNKYFLRETGKYLGKEIKNIISDKYFKHFIN
jgi:hypothetical protein